MSDEFIKLLCAEFKKLLPDEQRLIMRLAYVLNDIQRRSEMNRRYLRKRKTNDK